MYILFENIFDNCPSDKSQASEFTINPSNELGANRLIRQIQVLFTNYIK